MVKKVQIIWGNKAKSDLNVIHNFYADKSKQTADKMIENIVKAVENIVFTEQYQVDEFLGQPYRRLIVRHTKIVYRIKNNSIFIFRIFDSRQDPSKLI